MLRMRTLMTYTDMLWSTAEIENKMRAVFLKGSTFFDVWYDAAGLAAIGCANLTLAVFTCRKVN